MFLHRFMVRPWSYNVLLCVRACVCVPFLSNIQTNNRVLWFLPAAGSQVPASTSLPSVPPLSPVTQNTAPNMRWFIFSLSFSHSLFLAHMHNQLFMHMRLHNQLFMHMLWLLFLSLFHFFSIILKTHFCWRCIFKSIFCEFSKSLFSLLANYC